MAVKEIRVLWLAGNRRQREEVFGKVKAKFASQYGEFDHIVCGPDTTYETFEGQVLQSDCFSNNRLIEVTGLPITTASRQTFVNRVKKLLDHVPLDCLVVFNGIDPAGERAVSAHVGKVGRIWEFENTVSAIDADGMVVEVAAEQGKAIEQADARRVVKSMRSEGGEGKAYDIDHLRLTVDRLCLFVGNRKSIKAEDVDAACPSMGHITVWTLFDLLDDRKYEAAVGASQQLLSYGFANDTVRFGMEFCNVCYWRYKLLMFVKESQACGRSDKEVIADAGELQRLKWEGQEWGKKMLPAEKAAYTAYAVQNLLGNGLTPTPLEKYTRKRLYQINECVEDMFEQATAGRSAPEVAMMIDLFIMLACDKIDDNRRRKLWKLVEHDVRT